MSGKLTIKDLKWEGTDSRRFKSSYSYFFNMKSIEPPIDFDQFVFTIKLHKIELPTEIKTSGYIPTHMYGFMAGVCEKNHHPHTYFGGSRSGGTGWGWVELINDVVGPRNKVVMKTQESYSEGDEVTISVDRPRKTLEFLKNGKNMGKLEHVRFPRKEDELVISVSLHYAAEFELTFFSGNYYNLPAVENKKKKKKKKKNSKRSSSIIESENVKNNNGRRNSSSDGMIEEMGQMKKMSSRNIETIKRMKKKIIDQQRNLETLSKQLEFQKGAIEKLEEEKTIEKRGSIQQQEQQEKERIIRKKKEEEQEKLKIFFLKERKKNETQKSIIEKLYKEIDYYKQQQQQQQQRTNEQEEQQQNEIMNEKKINSLQQEISELKEQVSILSSSSPSSDQKKKKKKKKKTKKKVCIISKRRKKKKKKKSRVKTNVKLFGDRKDELLLLKKRVMIKKSRHIPVEPRVVSPNVPHVFSKESGEVIEFF